MSLSKAPKNFMESKPLYKPYKSTKSGKEGMVYVKNSSGGKKLIHYGDSKMGQHPNDPARKKSYCARSAGIKDGNGNLTKNNKNSPNYWSRKLWRC